MDNTSLRKCIEELASPTVKIIPSKDLDAYDYELFLNFASQAELEGDYFTSETFTKIEGYKIQGLISRVLEEIIKYVCVTDVTEHNEPH